MRARTISALPPVDQRTLPTVFERILDERPDSVAHLDGVQEITFADVHTRSLRLAGGLTELGIRPGEPVLTMMTNSLDAVHLWIACGLTGRIDVPVNTAYKGEMLAYLINDSGAATIVLEAEYVDRLLHVADRVPSLTTVVVHGDLQDNAGLRRRFRVVPFAELLQRRPESVVRAHPSDITALMYTSGTTGPSKGVRCTQAQAYTYASWEDVGLPAAGERTLVCLPIFHLAGLWHGFYRSLISGTSCVIRDSFSVGDFWPDIRRFEVSNTLLLESMATLLLAQEPRRDDADNPLEWVTIVPVPQNLGEFGDRFGVEVLAGYGMTEIGIVAAAGPGQTRGGSAGTARDDFELKVVDENDQEVPRGTIGELVVRPREPWLLMDGYHGRPEETVKAWRNLWFHTGDAVSQEEDGHFFFRDRLKDSMRRRGENVSSMEVETAILRHPSVADVAVVAVPSDLTEDEIKAVVVAADNCTIDMVELTEFLIEELPHFMVPRYIDTLGELPRTPTQKIRKGELREAGVTATTWDRESAGIVARGGRFSRMGRNTE